MASLYQKRGFYFIDFWIGNKRKTINTQFKATARNFQLADNMKKEIEREVEIKKKEIKQRSYEISATEYQKDLTTQLSLSELVSKYKIKLSVRSLSHQELFDIAINHLFEIVPVDIKVTNITPEHIIMFIRSLQNKVQNASLITYMNYLKGFFNYLVDEEYIVKSPIRKKDCPRKHRKSIVTFSERMLNQILIIAKERDYMFYCILNLLALTGIRPCDLLRLKVADFNLDIKIIDVKISKTRKEIKFPIYNELYKFLTEEMNIKNFSDKDALLFGKYSVRIIGGRFRKIKRFLKITEKHKYTLKSFRKTFATIYAKKLDIQDVAYLLGHDETETTRTYYADTIVENLRSKMDKI
ncbi:MAG TPA: site-specific integrase [Ignavibacteria bacterium]